MNLRGRVGVVIVKGDNMALPKGHVIAGPTWGGGTIMRVVGTGTDQSKNERWDVESKSWMDGGNEELWDIAHGGLPADDPEAEVREE